MSVMYVMDKINNTPYLIPDVDAVLTDSIDGTKDLTFSITLTPNNVIPFNALVGRNFILVDEIKHKSQRYFINAPTLRQEGEQLAKDITATHIYVFRLGKHYISGAISGEKSLDEALKFALRDSGFTHVIMKDAEGISSQKLEGFGNKYSLELMNDIISTYSVELDVDNTTIYVYSKIGKKLKKKLHSGVNLTSLQITTSEDNTYTRIKGYGKKKEEKDILGDESISYESKTGEWSYDSTLKADYTKKIGATFTFSFKGTGFKFKTLVSKLGGKWEFKIDDQTKTISAYSDSDPEEKTFDVIRGLDSKTHKVVATFKGKDSKNPNTKGTKGAAPVMYLLQGDIFTIYRSFKNENEEYVFPPVIYIHPDEKKYLIEGKPSWAPDYTDDSITKESDMIKVLKTKVNPYAETSYSVNYHEVFELLEIEEPVEKGDTIEVFAETALNGVTFEDSIRITAVSYNPNDLTQAPSLTINGGKKTPEDRIAEEKKRAKETERSIKAIRNEYAAQISEIKSEFQQAIINSQTSKYPQTFPFTLQYVGGIWSVSTGGEVSTLEKELLLFSDDEFNVKYVSSETSSLLKQKGIAVSVDYEGNSTDHFRVSFYQNGQQINPTTLPDNSKVTVLINGFMED
ncbi:phage tail protein [Bacillus spizizenii]|nr:phage tail protein [Bacillus spizizenii]MCY8311707.1 phage tail protein [Bacillus spizizenii]MCY8418784.1 phage tail protein [Bacillus spizizenii]MCY9332661.1 phage tail protein [Bacillus spizizenii]MEC0620530.1 phage tail protein [Bacillus spizizenii]